MEPQIKYATTEDGVNIAYRTFGEGEPALVLMENLASHIQLESKIQRVERAYTLLAEQRMVVRFDFRGFGTTGPSGAPCPAT